MAPAEMPQPETERLRIGHVEVDLRRLVSRSATSDVFEAATMPDGARAALKLFADWNLAAREEKILRLLDGNGAPGLIAAGFADSRKALLMEWGRGLPLSQRWEVGTTSDDDARTILTAVARAVGALHRKGVLHRDLKPEHILLDEDGSVTLLDFSAAAMLDDMRERDLPATSGAAAPEQMDGNGEGPWTDVFGFGAVLCWHLTGLVPGKSTISDLSSAPDKSILALVRSCLAPEPEHRPPSMEEVASRLEGAEFPDAVPTGHDPFPETKLIRMRGSGSIPETRTNEGEIHNIRRRRVLPLAVAALFLASAGWGAYLGFLPFYERHFKRDWVIDTTGGGDALTLSEVLRRGGPKLRVQLSQGRHVFAPVEGRQIEVTPSSGLEAPPRIVAVGGNCAEFSDSNVRLAGVVLEGEGGGEGLSCIVVDGGEAILSDVAIDSATGVGLDVSGGAHLEADALKIADSGGDGLRASGGSVIALTNAVIQNVGSVGVRATEGSRLNASGLRVSKTTAAGIAVGSGAWATLVGIEVQATAGSGLDVAQGASVDLRNSSIKGSAAAGIGIYEGASARLEEVEISANALSGLFVAGASRLDLRKVTMAKNGEHGAVLLDLRQGAFGTVDVRENKGVGLAIFPGVDLKLDNVTVVGNGGGDIIDGRAADKPSAEPKGSE